jgi:hypothetical protein
MVKNNYLELDKATLVEWVDKGLVLVLEKRNNKIRV